MNIHPITFRFAVHSDAAVIEQLIDRSVRVLQADDYSQAQMNGAIGTVFAVDYELIRDQTYYVAECDGVLAGCGGWSRRESLYGGSAEHGTASPLLVPGRDAARIRAFFVAPEHTRKGIGSRLLQRCADAAAAAGFTRLELVATLSGERLYRQHGFEKIAPMLVRLPSGIELPCVHMGKALPVA